MTIEKVGGSQGQSHVELWGKKDEMVALQNNASQINELANDTSSDVLFLTLDEAEVYYLDKQTKTFKVLGE